MADIANLVEELSKLTVIEAADLVKQLETKWGVSAAAPVAVAAAGGAPAGGAAASGRKYSARGSSPPFPPAPLHHRAVFAGDGGAGLFYRAAAIRGSGRRTGGAARSGIANFGN